MSATPRTDAAVFTAETYAGNVYEAVDPDVARQLETELIAALAERDGLQQWKESAMSVTPPMQEIGRALGVRLGSSIHDKILPGITKLRADLAARDAVIEKMKTALNHWNKGEQHADKGEWVAASVHYDEAGKLTAALLSTLAPQDGKEKQV